MSEFDSRDVDRGDCCVQLPCPYSKQELEEYAAVVRLCIQNEDDALFRNKSVWHAAIILREFISAAQESVRVFCGRLNSAVYGKLLSEFKAACERGVDVKVLTVSSNVCAVDVAKNLVMQGAFRVMNEETDFPHFVLVDGKRYRLETDEEDKSAIVCACAQSDENVRMAASLDVVFDTFWEDTYSYVPESI